MFIVFLCTMFFTELKGGDNMAEIRRVVRHGGGFSINIPKKMLTELGLKIGDHVICELREEELIILKLNTPGVRQWASRSRVEKAAG